MAFDELTSEQITGLVGTRHATTGIEYPPSGMQPYYEWLLRSLHLLAESAAGALRVAADDSGGLVVHVAAGRATINNIVVDYIGGELDLSTYNNDTALIWLAESSGAASVGIAAAGAGWTASPHIKLAEVTLAAGDITAILDRRFETIFNA